jgi:hypothetical protein
MKQIDQDEILFNHLTTLIDELSKGIIIDSDNSYSDEFIKGHNHAINKTVVMLQQQALPLLMNIRAWNQEPKRWLIMFTSGYYADEGCKEPDFEVWKTKHELKRRAGFPEFDQNGKEKTDCKFSAVVEETTSIKAWNRIKKYFPDATFRASMKKEDYYENE